MTRVLLSLVESHSSCILLVIGLVVGPLLRSVPSLSLLDDVRASLPAHVMEQEEWDSATSSVDILLYMFEGAIT
ncbi:hypothetical protein VNO80_03097 [Phaseolus coccineus]|uniref:Uncharacterized protein n=1 Tax=Phaseolus coccineus TaxID=3886 RepID=A0AAN9NVF2_PHACN